MTRPPAERRRRPADRRATTGIEFLFAQFVDMHGKPSAKLVPAHHLDDLLDRRRRLRRVRRRRHRPGPRRPGHDRDARPAHADDPAVAPERRALRLRRHGRGRAVAVLPAHDPAPRARPGRGAGLRAQDRRRARVLPAAPRRRRQARARRPARHARAALLRHARADAQPRLRLRGLARRSPALGWDNYATDHEDANGQFEQNFAVRRRADHLRPGDLLPLHGRVAGPAARADRDVHAQAVRASDRQRLPLPRQPVARRRERVRARPGRGSPRPRACRSSPTASSAGSRRTPRRTSR